MAKMKAFELKKLINEQTNKNLESKDILDFLEKNTGVKKTHSSNLEENEVNLIKSHFVPQTARSSQTADTKTASQPTTRKSEADSKPAARRPIAPSTTTAGGSQLVQRPATVQRPDTVIRPETDRKPAPSKSVGYQGTQGSYHTGRKPEAAQRIPQPAQAATQKASQTDKTETTQRGQRSAAQSAQRTPQADRMEAAQATQSTQASTASTTQSQTRLTQPAQKPAQEAGQTYTRPEQNTESAGRSSAQQTHQNNQANNSGQRQEGHQSGMQQRTYGQNSHTGQRADGSQRPSDQGQSRQNQGQRYQQGDYQKSSNTSNQNRQGGYNNAQNEAGSQQGRYQGGNNQGGTRGQGSGYQGNRPQGSGYQGNRPQGSGYQGNRPQGSGYQGNRPQGSGYQGNRSQEGGYQGNRSQEGGYQGNRPQGSGYQGNRPAGQGGGYQGNRPQGGGYQGNRSQEGGYQGNRPQGGGYQGNRPQGGGYQGNRPGGQGGGYPRQGSGTGQRTGGYNNFRGDEFKKDEDDKPSFGRGAQGAKKGAKGSDRKNFDQQILDQKVAEKNDFSNKRNRDRINKEKTYKDKTLIEREEFDSKDNMLKTKLMPKKGQFIQPKPVEVKEEEIKSISVPDIITIKDLADKMKMPASALVKKLFLAGKMVSINQEITYEEAEEIALEYDILVEKEVKVNEVEELLKEEEEDPDTMVKRPPVVCVMGHVDHGKTSLLDAIRATNVTSREAGGITQHIGAYVVEIKGEKITFLDTPGHEAFTSMRMRGAKSTDIAILVVAADDGVMPQTVEAISHAKAAGVQIIVAVNKIDKPSANIERVKQELTEYELVAEDWGGETIFVPVSAHTKEGIDRLLEMILLTAEMEELKANPSRNARGIVIEAELDKGRGPVATILVQKGTLTVGDNIVVGPAFGKVRAMMDDKGRKVKEATPSMPVEILGLSEVPEAGETFLMTTTEKEARNIADAYISQGKEKLIAETKAKLSLDGLFSQIQAGNIKELNLIIKADVQGSVEAMKQSLLKLSNDEVAVRVIHGGVGAINESDVKLASTSNAIVIGFNVKPDNAAKETGDREGVDIKFYRVIYNAIDDIENAMKGLLDPIFEERVMGHAEVRQTFKASGIGTIAGSYVTDGKIIRGCKARIYRDNALVHEGTLASLKRFQDDVKEVATGYECGLVFEKFNDIKEGDRVELYNMVEVPR